MMSLVATSRHTCPIYRKGPEPFYVALNIYSLCAVVRKVNWKKKRLFEMDL